MPMPDDYTNAEGTSSRLLRLVEVGHEVKIIANIGDIGLSGYCLKLF